jgi:hypothetical protein
VAPGPRTVHAPLAPLKERQWWEQTGQEPRWPRGHAPRWRPAPASRGLHLGPGRGPEGCANVPTAGAAPHTRIVAGAGPTAPSDRDGRRPMALAATAVLERPCEVGAERGDSPGDAGKAGVEAGLPPSVARPLPSAHKPLGLCSQAALPSHGVTDTAQGPAGALRTCRCDTGAVGRPRRSDATAAGKAWGRQQAGTRRQEGRRLTRGVAAHLRKERAPRGRRRPQGRQRRTMLVAPPWGTRTRWGDAGDG